MSIELLRLSAIDPDDQQQLIISNEKMKMKLSDEEYEKVVGKLNFYSFKITFIHLFTLSIFIYGHF